jgi:phosphohistidine phosphatase
MEDHDRVLADSGRADASRMGQFFKDEGLMPALVLCSTAARTRQTLELLLAGWDVTPTVRLSGDLYLARWLSIVNLLRQLRETAETVMVIGHNPGLEECARQLAHPPGDPKTRKLRQLLQDDYPTATATVLAFGIAEWSAVDRSEGELEYFVRPRDLKD